MGHVRSESGQNINDTQYGNYFENQEPFKGSHFAKEGTSQVEESELKERAFLDRVKELAKEHFYTLKRFPSKKELYTVNLITEGYLETSFMISSLLKVCITALDAERTPNRVVPEPDQNIKEVLGYVLNMIPYEEMEFLDKFRHILPDIETK